MPRKIKPMVIAFLAMAFITNGYADTSLNVDEILASATVQIGAQENGEKRTGQALIWHDESGSAEVKDALIAFNAGKFQPLQSAGSTGLHPCAFWTLFKLNNHTAEQLTLNLEYVDHQLIQIQAYRVNLTEQSPTHLISLEMEAPFANRPVDHPRFVLPIEIQGNNEQVYLVRMNSHGSGYIFPSMRIWSPEKLTRATLIETSLISFLFGGFFLMAVFAIVAGTASRQKIFYVYSVYAVAKIMAWATILGFTHQYVITDSFQWHYMSMSGAFVIFSGFLFARLFLKTKQHIPLLDKVFLLGLANAILLFIGAVLEWKTLAHVSITLALFMYPIIVLAGAIRWRQGSLESGIFTLAWLFLVVGLVVQACRDLGAVEHNFVNYYWPPVASFVELLAIMAALGVQVNRLRRQKNQAEFEAQTDHLTGIANRRSFFTQFSQRFDDANKENTSVCLLIVDVDHFKQVNDKYGHNIGDQALITFCKTVEGVLGANDIFGRLGGEEFGLVVNDNLTSAKHFAERLREEVTNIAIPLETETVTLSVSIGVTEIKSNDTIESVFSRADEALYKAKANGRNRVEAAQDK